MIGIADLRLAPSLGSPPATYFSACVFLPCSNQSFNPYHLFNHVNVFGVGYAPRVRSVLDHYA